MQTRWERDGRERVRTVDPELLLQEIRSGRRITIVDVRSREEFRGACGRIPGALSFPMAELAPRREELDGHRHDPIVVVSSDGRTSLLAGLELELAGFTEVRSLEGGMDRWRALGFPVTFGSSPPPPLGAGRA